LFIKVCAQSDKMRKQPKGWLNHNSHLLREPPCQGLLHRKAKALCVMVSSYGILEERPYPFAGYPPMRERSTLSGLGALLWSHYVVTTDNISHAIGSSLLTKSAPQIHGSLTKRSRPLYWGLLLLTSVDVCAFPHMGLAYASANSGRSLRYRHP
jgi:hypothetical protein